MLASPIASSALFLLLLPLLGAARGEPAAEVVEGVAGDAKGGAILITEDGRVLYLVGLDSWPSWALGHPVTATGTVSEQDYLPKATQDKDGAWTQGTTGGKDTVLQSTGWYMHAPPAPWSVSYSDGSGNASRLWADEEGVGWSYDPVQPAQSSSGTYSGGEPAAGSLEPEQAGQLWSRMVELEVSPQHHAPQRAKGTGAFSITTPDGERGFLVVSDAASGFDVMLKQLRGL
ncbi:MAG TPA: hypothetical protein QGF58_19300 [Myxococcota bacterium]|nr:hypothetical protein [Myxococcota bacterium]